MKADLSEIRCDVCGVVVKLLTIPENRYALQLERHFRGRKVCKGSTIRVETQASVERRKLVEEIERHLKGQI